MSYRYEKNPVTGTQEIVIDGFEKGIASSPHQGLGNLQSVNTSTEMGEVMCSFNRVKQTSDSGTGTILAVNCSGLR